MIDSSSQNATKTGQSYMIGQDLYTASVEEMRGWVDLLTQDIIRLNEAIEKKQDERSAAESIFSKPT